MSNLPSGRTQFDGRYGVQHGRDYEHYRFTNPSDEKLRELILDSTPSGDPWGEATLSYDADGVGSQMYILSHPKLGYFLRFGDLKDEQGGLSCWDRNLLSVVECPDDLEVSAGLFLPPSVALDAVLEFFQTGRATTRIEWISPSDIPSGGNFV